MTTNKPVEYGQVKCPLCENIVWDGPNDYGMYKCWNDECYKESGYHLAFDYVIDNDEQEQQS